MKTKINSYGSIPLVVSLGFGSLCAEEPTFREQIDNLDAKVIALEKRLIQKNDQARKFNLYIAQAQARLNQIRANRSSPTDTPINPPDEESASPKPLIPRDPQNLPSIPPVSPKNTYPNNLIEDKKNRKSKGYYIQAFGGFTIPEEFRLLVLENGSPVTSDEVADRYRPVKSRNGYSTGLLFGRDFGTFRIETEMSTRRSNIQSIDLFGYPNLQQLPSFKTVQVTGYSATYGGLVNAIYDIDLTSKLGIFLGVGAGVNSARIKVENIRYRDTTFAYQIMSGLAWSITERCSLRLLYKYFISSGSKKSHFNNATEMIDQQFESLGSHNLELGLEVDL